MNILISGIGKYFASDTLFSRMWNDNTPVNFHNNHLRQIISRLNIKVMKETGGVVQLIENSHGVRYRLAYFS